MTSFFSRRTALASGLLALALSFTGLSAQAQTTTLKVGATAVPHSEILTEIKPLLEAQGIKLEIIEFADYVLPNRALEDKELDANFFQHKPYMDTFNKTHSTHLVVPENGAIHIEPFGAYSKKITNINDLKNGAVVALPNDPTNGARALLLLHNNGIIQLKDPTNLLSTPLDLAANPKKLEFLEMNAAQLPHVLADVDLALINTNFALQGGLNPLKDALIIEGEDSPYANIVAVRADNVNSPAIAKLVEALRSEQAKKFIIEHYKGAIAPVF
ncbi:MAG: MetQ/NlpA family ABC transporter substrate-binding protein [Saezia sp.]